MTQSEVKAMIKKARWVWVTVPGKEGPHYFRITKREATSQLVECPDIRDHLDMSMHFTEDMYINSPL